MNLFCLFSRDQGSKREMNEEERLLRLFCVVPKTMTDQMLRDHFKKFGDIDYVSVVKDRETKESKGFAYVKFHKWVFVCACICGYVYMHRFIVYRLLQNTFSVVDIMSYQPTWLTVWQHFIMFHINVYVKLTYIRMKISFLECDRIYAVLARMDH